MKWKNFLIDLEENRNIYRVRAELYLKFYYWLSNMWNFNEKNLQVEISCIKNRNKKVKPSETRIKR